MRRGPVRIAIGLLAATLAFPAAAAAGRGTEVAQPPRLAGDLVGFGGDPRAIPDAIAQVEAHGGRVMEIRYSDRAGHPGYDVVVERGRRIEFARLAEPRAGFNEPPSHFVRMRASNEPDWMLGWRARRDLRLVKRAYVDLAGAVRTAEADDGGAPAAAAGVAVSASDPTSEVPAYNVLLLEHGRVRRVAVDARTGLPIADPGALARWP